jgi:hypothetical protein
VDLRPPCADRVLYCGRTRRWLWLPQNFLDSSAAAGRGARTRRRGLEGDQHAVVRPLLSVGDALFPAAVGQDGGASTHRRGLEAAR